MAVIGIATGVIGLTSLVRPAHDGAPEGVSSRILEVEEVAR
jgi:hypothetical protein